MKVKTKSDKIYLIVGCIILSAIIFKSELGVLVATVIFWALVLGALFVFPAVIGAVAGSTVSDCVRWLKHWQHPKRMRGFAKHLLK